MDLKTYLSLPGKTQTALAKRMNVSQGLIHQWAEGKRPISPAKCVELDAATDGMVTRKDSRPDDWQTIWPELADADRSPGRRKTDLVSGRRNVGASK